MSNWFAIETLIVNVLLTASPHPSLAHSPCPSSRRFSIALVPLISIPPCSVFLQKSSGIWTLGPVELFLGFLSGHPLHLYPTPSHLSSQKEGQMRHHLHFNKIPRSDVEETEISRHFPLETLGQDDLWDKSYCLDIVPVQSADRGCEWWPQIVRLS